MQTIKELVNDYNGMVEKYNQLNGPEVKTAVKKFRDMSTALRRTEGMAVEVDDLVKLINLSTKPGMPIASNEEKVKEVKVNGKPGVCKAIEEVLRGAPTTKAELLTELTKQFPDRNQKSMKSSIDTLVPTDLRKLRGLDVQVTKTEEGKRYFIVA